MPICTDLRLCLFGDSGGSILSIYGDCANDDSLGAIDDAAAQMTVAVLSVMEMDGQEQVAERLLSWTVVCSWPNENGLWMLIPPKVLTSIVFSHVLTS